MVFSVRGTAVPMLKCGECCGMLYVMGMRAVLAISRVWDLHIHTGATGTAQLLIIYQLPTRPHHLSPQKRSSLNLYKRMRKDALSSLTSLC